MHCARGLSVHSLKSFGDKVITEQLFMVRDFLDAVLKFDIGTLNIAYTLLEDLFIQFKEVAKVGELLNFEACMDMMDLLYEIEETSLLYQSSTSLAASILCQNNSMTSLSSLRVISSSTWAHSSTRKPNQKISHYLHQPTPLFHQTHFLYFQSPTPRISQPFRFLTHKFH
ncbi:PREDICTED: cyclin-J18-like isoform X2 [Camelina sativa]|uniref:Cyclin-J18-like isoform X2 n=1 Tax=Camelina sativa TaxID=90675 RepID=A0ABM0YH13_CAMSA|nr:PREDICTED: cyclin-J18-like isoform X2 [Camelina sativa]XP_010500751.1 PREDICTED: cyclin-J18-like isoform X2 [Camelina sativa]